MFMFCHVSFQAIKGIALLKLALTTFQSKPTELSSLHADFLEVRTGFYRKQKNIQRYKKQTLISKMCNQGKRISEPIFGML